MKNLKINLDNGKLEINAQITHFVWDTIMIILEEAAKCGLVKDVSVIKDGKKITEKDIVEKIMGLTRDDGVKEDGDNQAFSA